MKICFPTQDLRGLESSVYSHFGSAPGFVIVDTETMKADEIPNEDLHHAHGMCQPLKALGGLKVDGIAVGGIGMGALMKLQNEGIIVYRALEGSVQDNLKFIEEGKLPRFAKEHTCAGHEGGCGPH